MGNRANIFLAEPSYTAAPATGVFLYTHWGGFELPLVLQDALKRSESRWNDSYLGRVIFSEMVKGDVLGTTGYGISTALTDNSYPIIRVDRESQTVSFCREHLTNPTPSIEFVWTFAEYVKLTRAQLETAWGEACQRSFRLSLDQRRDDYNGAAERATGTQ